MRKKILIILGVLIGLIVIIVALAFFLTQGAVTAVTDELAALKAKNTDNAYALTDAAFQSATAKTTFQSYLDANPYLTTYQSYSIPERSTENNSGKVVVALKDQTGTVIRYNFYVQKDANTWKVHAIEVFPDDKSKIPAVALPSFKTYEITSQAYTDQGYTLTLPKSFTVEHPDKYSTTAYGTGAEDKEVTIDIQKIILIDPAVELDKLKNQFKQIDPNNKFGNETDYTYTFADGTSVLSKSVLVTFKQDNKDYKQWVLLVPNTKTGILYFWTYTTPVSLFEKYITLAQDIAKAWDIAL